MFAISTYKQFLYHKNDPPNILVGLKDETLKLSKAGEKKYIICNNFTFTQCNYINNSMVSNTLHMNHLTLTKSFLYKQMI